MDCCLRSNPPDHLSPEHAKLSTNLTIISVIQLVLAFITFFASPWEAILLLIGAILLFVIGCMPNYMLCVGYIFVSIYGGITCVLRVG